MMIHECYKSWERIMKLFIFILFLFCEEFWRECCIDSNIVFFGFENKSFFDKNSQNRIYSNTILTEKSCNRTCWWAPEFEKSQVDARFLFRISKMLNCADLHRWTISHEMYLCKKLRKNWNFTYFSYNRLIHTYKSTYDRYQNSQK